MTDETTTSPPTTRSRAAIFAGTPGELRLTTLATPCPGRGEVLVRVLGCTICGSDLHSIHGRREVPVPTVLGHEIVGRIEAWGDGGPPRDATGAPLAVGDRVTWAVVASCGRCLACRRGLPQKCRQGTKYGHEPLQPGRELLGGLAEHCLLVEGTAVVRLPEAVPLEIACPASCATAVAVCEAAGVIAVGASPHQRAAPPHDATIDATVCVLGAGLLGLHAIACAAVTGTRVLCIEPDPHRRALAEACGATACCPPQDAAALVEATTAGAGCDAVLELSGANSGWDTSWRLVRTGGQIVLAGAVVPVPAVTVEPEQIVRRHVSIHGVHNYAPRHLVEVVAFLAAHGARLPLADLVAEWFPLERIDDAVARVADRSVVRVGVRP